MSEWIRQLDLSLFFLINRDLQNSFFDFIMPVITNRSYLIILPFLALLLIKEKNKAFVIFVLSIISVLLADGLGSAFKHLIQRPRPCDVLENINLLIGCGKSFSMPSNHAVNSFAFAVPFLLASRNRLTYFFPGIAVLVCFSRVYLGVHYPSDVILGAALGSLVSGAVVNLYRWSGRRFESEPSQTVVFLFLLAISMFRVYYILDGPLDLGPDEAHYWEWSRRPDLSYYSKGPMISYLISLGTSLFGNTVFGIRILAALFSVLTSVFLYKLGKDLYNERVGASSAILFQIIPLYAPFGVVFTIDSPFIFFWTLSLYLFWKVVDRDASREGDDEREDVPPCTPRRLPGSPLFHWILLGISIGLGLLTKYTMSFFFLCALLFLLFSEGRRKTLKSANPYISAAVSLVLFSPVVIWNMQHGWVTLRHTAGQAHLGDGFRLSAASLLEFVGSQVGVLSPVLFLLMMIALWRPRAGKTRTFLLSFSVPVIAFFVMKSVQGKVQANWAMMGYITGIIALSGVFISRWKEHTAAVKAILAAGIALSFVITAVAHYPGKFHIPLKIDPSARLRGWHELGDEVTTVLSDLQTRGDVFIFSDSYQVSSELAFYVKGHPVTYCVNLGRRMNQYDLWPGFHSLIHYHAIFVTIDDSELPVTIKDAFENSEKRLLKVKENGRLLREYSIFICHDFKGMKREPVRSY